jgi:hypothetical protein
MNSPHRDPPEEIHETASGGNIMKRRTLDYIFSAGGVLLAVLLLILGLVMRSNADFAKNYVHDQLLEQRITFTPVAGLSDAEKNVPCLVKYAGTPLDSGVKAECYSNQYIGDHLKTSVLTVKNADGTPLMMPDGKTPVDLTKVGTPPGPATYATITQVTNQFTAALKAPVAGGLTTDQLNAAIGVLNTTRDTMFKGETLRGLLLTSYGFSVFGEKGSQVETVGFLAALVLLLASIAGFIHAIRTPKDKVVGTHPEFATAA